MNRVRLGTQLRAIRLQRCLRQTDVARLARTSATTISRAERGECVAMPTLERVAAALGAEIDLSVRWHGGDLQRAVNRAHAALAEQVVSWMASRPGWRAIAEVSFSIWGERGIVDVLGLHEATRHVAIVELKTSLPDLNEHLVSLDRKARLARQIARDHGFEAELVSVWLIVADSRTNRRRVSEQRALITSKLPADGRALRAWLARPQETIRGVAFWPDNRDVAARREVTGRKRVRRRPKGDDAGGSRTKR